MPHRHRDHLLRMSAPVDVGAGANKDQPTCERCSTRKPRNREATSRPHRGHGYVAIGLPRSSGHQAGTMRRQCYTHVVLRSVRPWLAERLTFFRILGLGLVTGGTTLLCSQPFFRNLGDADALTALRPYYRAEAQERRGGHHIKTSAP